MSDQHPLSPVASPDGHVRAPLPRRSTVPATGSNPAGGSIWFTGFDLASPSTASSAAGLGSCPQLHDRRSGRPCSGTTSSAKRIVDLGPRRVTPRRGGGSTRGGRRPACASDDLTGQAKCWYTPWDGGARQQRPCATPWPLRSWEVELARRGPHQPEASPFQVSIATSSRLWAACGRARPRPRPCLDFR